MPLELLHGDGSELIKYLVSRGLIIGTSRTQHEKLKNYINLSPTDKTIICTGKIGWNEEVYVFPDESIGAAEHPIIYQPEYATAHKFRVKGSLEEWQHHISKKCIGNSRLEFAVSLAFAAPILPLVNVQSGGFHNRGWTSKGKTTVSLVAGSVFGGSDEELGYCQSWRATCNGLESVAEIHNHALLCLDEMAQVDGKDAAAAAYMLAQGSGKARMTRRITPRRPLSWKLLFLSNGEISLADKVGEVNILAKGGQEVRVVDLPVDGCKHGIFDTLHDFETGQEFADYLRSATRKYYGSPIRVFLKTLVKYDVSKIESSWNDFQRKFIGKMLPATRKYPEEVIRVASRFALVAFAGEIATKFGITKWNAGSPSNAAFKLFGAWFSNRKGYGATDAERAIARVRAFIELHAASRFEVLTTNGDSLETLKIFNRAGFKKANDDEPSEYLFLPEVFRTEVCKGLDSTMVCKVLAARGLLRRDARGYQKQLKYGGQQIRPYWVSERILDDSDPDDIKEALDNLAEEYELPAQVT